MVQTIRIEAAAREQAGKGAARATRRAGHVPAVIYGAKQEATLISLDPRIVGYVKAAAKAVAENAGDFAKDMEVEMAAHHPVLRYAGTYDFLFGTTLWDWKTGDDPQSEIQLGGYVAMIESRRPVKSCAAIELHEDWSYGMRVFKPSRCKALFLAALSIFGWLETNKINMKKESVA